MAGRSCRSDDLQEIVDRSNEEESGNVEPKFSQAGTSGSVTQPPMHSRFGHVPPAKVSRITVTVDSEVPQQSQNPNISPMHMLATTQSHCCHFSAFLNQTAAIELKQKIDRFAEKFWGKSSKTPVDKTLWRLRSESSTAADYLSLARPCDRNPSRSEMDSNSNIPCWGSPAFMSKRRETVDRLMRSSQAYLDTPPTLQVVAGDLRTLVAGFEEQIFQVATDELDYLRRISSEMERKAFLAERPSQGSPATGIETPQATDIIQDGGVITVRYFRNGDQLLPPRVFPGPAQQRLHLRAQIARDNPNALIMESSTGWDMVVYIP